MTFSSVDTFYIFESNLCSISSKYNPVLVQYRAQRIKLYVSLLLRMSSNARNASAVSASGRKHSVAEQHVTTVLPSGDIALVDDELSADDQALAALGYKYVQKVRIIMD